MKHIAKLHAGIILVAFLLVSCEKDPIAPTEPQVSKASSLSKGAVEGSSNAVAAVSVFATGLNNPRGLKFGPDGYLYVAEGGAGGTNSTAGICDQVIPPVGPYTGGSTARISKISPAGVRSTVADNLPSSQTSPALGGLVSGVADVEFVGNTLYALLAGAGCSHGFPSVPNGVIKINTDGSWTLIANLSAWQQTHPVANPEEDDFEPDGTWYSMINVRGDLYAIEPNHGEMVKITPSGDISRVVDISATYGHVVPTSVAYHGDFYVGNLGLFPITEGSSNIYKITPSGGIKVWASGFTTVLGVAFDRQARMYVLENTTGNPFPTPGTGRITRVNPSGAKETIVSGLFLPAAMTFGPDGKLYISNIGFGPPPIGLGQVLQIDVPE